MEATIAWIVKTSKFISSIDSFPLFCIYLLMVLLSSQWKKIASPLDLRHVLVVYNFIASALSLYAAFGFTRVFLLVDSTFVTEPFDNLELVYRVYWLSKIFELLDTVFMILRHKQRQISFLHVFHHSSMLLLSDVSYHLYPYVGLIIYFGLNSYVHVLLYLYYGLSALKSENLVLWKKHLTQFQIVQFLIDGVHCTIGYLYHGHCIYGIMYSITMTAMFSNFYVKAYMKKSKVKSQ